MYISETYWNNFRNLKPRHLFWCSGLNLLTGKNGSGKTNMLEALNLACGWGTFYNARAAELRTWYGGNVTGNTEISCNALGEEQVISEIFISSRISVKTNKERTSFSELRAHIPALCFLPYDMNLIDGTPGVRRAFIDKLCALISIPYAKRLSDYKRLVRHRIKLLREGKSPNITSQLISFIGSWIWSVRCSAVKMLDENVSFESPLNALSPFPLRVSLKLGGMENGEECLNEADAMKDKFIEKLKFYSEREVKAKVPFVGPHRDDILISVYGNKGNSDFSPSAVLSRGQKRRSVISLILASGRVMELKLKRKPLFLLDEVFSELDEDGRLIVANALYDSGWQIFAASAENTFSNWQGKVYQLRDGDILKL